MVALIVAQRPPRGRAEHSVDRAVIISFPRQRALHIAHSCVAAVFRLGRRRSRRIFIHGVTASIVIRRVVIGVVRIVTVSVAVGIPQEGIVDEPKAVMEMTTMSVPGMVVAMVPIPMPRARAVSRDDASLIESLRTISRRPGSVRELPIRAQCAGIERRG